MSDREEFIQRMRALPKVDLHRHLEGSLRPETLWEFHCAQRQNFHESLEALRRACTIPQGEYPGFQGFLARFNSLRFKYGGLKALERVAAECVEDAAADGVAHLELRFSPSFGARRMKDLAPGAMPPPDSLEEVEAAAEATVAGATAQAKKSGIGVSFIICLGRHFGWEVNKPSTELLHRPVGKNFCGIDLAGDESFPGREFKRAFDDWKAAGRNVTIHAGEDPNGPGAANVSEALRELSADRIGHGVRVIENPALIETLRNKRTPLEMCPLSNVQTQACKSFAAHPLKALLAAGVLTTINTDDPAISATSLSEEYARAHLDCGLSLNELRQCAINAAQAAFLSTTEKDALVAKVSAAWRDLS
jgi:adenosine deaminase